MSEKIGGAKGSRLDEDFMELERVSFSLDSLMYLHNRPAWCCESAISLTAQLNKSKPRSVTKLLLTVDDSE